jgi:hypothetical protein
MVSGTFGDAVMLHRCMEVTLLFCDSFWQLGRPACVVGGREFLPDILWDVESRPPFGRGVHRFLLGAADVGH